MILMFEAKEVDSPISLLHLTKESHTPLTDAVVDQSSVNMQQE